MRWADISTGDELHPKYRSRILAKEIKIDTRPELFAATPPLEFIKNLISRCNPTDDFVDRYHETHPS